MNKNYDQNPTNGELKIMLDYVQSTMSRIEEVGKDTNTKASKTNGRVTSLEDTLKALSNLVQKHDEILVDKNDGLLTWKDRIVGSLQTIKIIYPVMAVLISTLFGFYIKDLKKTTSEEVITKLEAKYNLVIK